MSIIGDKKNLHNVEYIYVKIVSGIDKNNKEICKYKWIPLSNTNKTKASLKVPEGYNKAHG